MQFVHQTDSPLDICLPKPAPVLTGALASPMRDSTTESDGEHSANESEAISRDPSVTPPGSVLAKRARGSETPSRNVAARNYAEADGGAAEDEEEGSASGRKIWMRPCNDCGFELHVRRTKCTECGALQLSKRAAATAKEEEERKAIEAHDAARLQREAHDAASQLASICEGAGRDAATAAPAPLPAAAAASAPPASRARPDAFAVAKAYAGLSPEALQKLRRMHKLRALLNRVPVSVQQELRGRRAQSQGSAADAISMLASVATTM